MDAVPAEPGSGVGWDRDVVPLVEVDRRAGAWVGGKGANLGELTRVDGVEVPPGFCVTAAAYRRAVARDADVHALVARLAGLGPDATRSVSEASAQLRHTIEALAVPEDLRTEIERAIGELGPDVAWAVRSSATAEDLPEASFAGQQDSYLNVVGADAVAHHVRRCWASLYTDRAVAYRRTHGIDETTLAMAVVVQQLVVPDVSGVLFTADPVSGHRKVAVIEAVVGLGEALVSGQVSPDSSTVRDGEVVARSVGSQAFAVRPAASGGIEQAPLGSRRRDQPVLTDAHAVELAALGRRIEAHLGGPQDIEWCLTDGRFQVVQSRPITTLFPIPDAGDDAVHVYISVGHQQMMTDPIRPLGISLWQLAAARPMFEAGGRLFVDVAAQLASPTSRAMVLDALGRSDPLIRDAVESVLAQDGVVSPASGPVRPKAPAPAPASVAPLPTDRAIVADLVATAEASNIAAAAAIRGRTGLDLLEFIRADVAELVRVRSDPRGFEVFSTAMDAAFWLDEQIEAWLGERHVADVLTQSVDDDVTSEMGLALLDLADVVRPHPEVVGFLEGLDRDDFLDEMEALPGGRAVRDGFDAFLDRYGMRGVGEIDITRPRWRERPGALVPLILGYVRHVAPGEGRRRFEQGREEALAKQADVLRRLRALPDGAAKAVEAEARIDRLRTYIGYREYPKYFMITRYGIYRQALLAEADRLVHAGVLREADDLWFLTFNEVEEAERTRAVDHDVVEGRRAAFRSFAALTPPRVLTSDGEVFHGSYRRADVPPGALVGLAVSSGTVEGRARVIHDIGDATLEPGDIVVTTFTDPSWTPLFAAIAGLVTEVGGTMTHGAVIAREYGLPAVVGVERATQRITDGQRIRVHGSDGYVELLA